MAWTLYHRGNQQQQSEMRNAVDNFIGACKKNFSGVSLRKIILPKNSTFIGFSVNYKKESVYFQTASNRKYNGIITAFLFDFSTNNTVNKIVISRRYEFDSNPSLLSKMGNPGIQYFNTDVRPHFSHTASISSIPAVLGSISSATTPDDHLVVVQFSVNGATITIDEPPPVGGQPDWGTLEKRFASYPEAKAWIIDPARKSAPIPKPQPRDDNGATKSMSDLINEALERYRNVILEGVPGTGKTYHVGKLDGYETHWITFHPAVSYEDFMEGIRPAAAIQPAAASKLDDDSPPLIFEPRSADAPDAAKANGFAVREGFFLKVCRKAYDDPDKKFLVVIDEINRANLPNVLGDLLTLIEADKRLRRNKAGDDWDKESVHPVHLPYSGYGFAVPENVFVIGTMNTTDKSIAPIDAALRRRFAFIRIEPMTADEIRQQVKSVLPGKWPTLLTDSIDIWDALNGVLGTQLGPDGILGHSYLIQLAKRLAVNGVNADSAIRMCWQYELLPQLIDTLTNHAALDLINHPKLAFFHEFLRKLGLTLKLEGNGFGRGLRIGTLETPAPVGGAAGNQPVEAGHPTGSGQDQAEQPAHTTDETAESVQQAAE